MSRSFFMVVFLLSVSVVVFGKGPGSVLSQSGVNVLMFSSAIEHVAYPEGQLAQGPFYVHGNQSFFFVLKRGIEKAEFMVSLSNGDMLSLHFLVQHVPGHVIRISQEKGDVNRYLSKKNEIMEPVYEG